MAEVRMGSSILEEQLKALVKGKSEERKLSYHLGRAFKTLEQNPTAGIHIQKRLIPKAYLAAGVDNLWKYNLPDDWRLLYTVTKEEVIILCIILEWLPHKEYERKFKY